MDYKKKVEQMYEGFVKDINGDAYYAFDIDSLPPNHEIIVKCLKRHFSQVEAISNQTNFQYEYWRNAIEYVNSLYFYYLI